MSNTFIEFIYLNKQLHIS